MSRDAVTTATAGRIQQFQTLLARKCNRLGMLSVIPCEMGKTRSPMEGFMTQLALYLFNSSDEALFGSMGLWLFLSIGAVCLFVVFIPVVTWIDNRRKEREAFYKADTMRRLAEASADGARAAIEMMREEERLKRIKTLEGLKVGGIINLCVGIGLVIFLRALLGAGQGSPFLCGLIPGFIGIGMLVYAFFLAAPVE
jgi:hypothetical protein